MTTLIIEVFIYPAAWPTHLGLSWAGLFARGGGALSIDSPLKIR
jgi:putative oxidoreductase